jgi:K+-transporting ATPase ATPase C chain
MKSQTIIALKFLGIITVLTGIIYPLFISAVTSAFFPHQSKGSLIIKDGKIIGSELIGQKTDSAVYFWPRPSAVDYNPMPSGGSNYGPTSAKLQKFVNDKRHIFDSANCVTDTLAVPSEMITASASGLDPHISPKAAYMQVERISKARGFEAKQKAELKNLIAKLSEAPQFHLFGEERINVLKLNIELDKMKK